RLLAALHDREERLENHQQQRIVRDVEQLHQQARIFGDRLAGREERRQRRGVGLLHQLFAELRGGALLAELAAQRLRQVGPPGGEGLVEVRLVLAVGRALGGLVLRAVVLRLALLARRASAAIARGIDLPPGLLRAIVVGHGSLRGAYFFALLLPRFTFTSL